jgi:hypothetical protein
MNRLLVSHADNQDLIKEMGLEAFQKAKKLGDEAELRELRDFFYWQIYDEIAGDWPEKVSNAQNRAYDAEFQVIQLARALEKEKMEAQKILEKEKMEAQKILEKEKRIRMEAKKALQEEQKKAKKLEQAQKKMLEQEQKRTKIVVEQEKIKLMNNLLAAGLAIDMVAQSLEVSVEQIKVWTKFKK